MSFVSSKGNILCRLIKIELYKIFTIINRAIKGLHCILHEGLIGSYLYGSCGPMKKICSVLLTKHGGPLTTFNDLSHQISGPSGRRVLKLVRETVNFSLCKTSNIMCKLSLQLTYVCGEVGGGFSIQSPSRPVTRLQMNWDGFSGERAITISPLKDKHQGFNLTHWPLKDVAAI